MSVSTIPGSLTVTQAARAANVSKSTIRREIAAGHLNPVRIGGRVVRVLDEELARWMRASQVAPPSVHGAASAPAADKVLTPSQRPDGGLS